MTATDLYDAGFTALVSVIPPGAQVSPDSKIPPKDVGKAPGRRNTQGLYAGYAWREYVPSRDDAALWDAHGNNVGLAAAQFPGFDIDILDPDLAAMAKTVIETELGITLTRYGRRPKVLLMYRAAEPMKSFRAYYEHDLLGIRQLVEFLCEGNQYVVAGTHPVTGQPYELEDPIGATGLLGADALRAITIDEVTHVFEKLAEAFKSRGYTLTHQTGTGALAAPVDQDSLAAPSAEDLAALIADTPNVLESREEWIQFGYAIKAAGQADPGAAYQAWAEWCSRWDGPNDPGCVEHEWEKMQPPYRAGYGWLLDYARKVGVDVASREFGPAASAPPHTANQPAGEAIAAPKGQGGDPEVEASRAALAARLGTPGKFTDSSLAQEFIDAFGMDYMYVPELDTVYHWNGKTWAVEKGLSHKVQEFLDHRADDARELIQKPSERDSVVNKLGSRKTRLNVLGNIMDSPRIVHRVDQLDSAADILNTPAGPVDLRTGEMVTAERERYLIRSTVVAPDFEADCPRWKQFVQETMLGQGDMAEYLQILVGYMLTGRVDDQIFPFFRGSGANGKSKFTEVLTGIMGLGERGYAAVVSKDLLQITSSNRGRDPRREIARLVGKRLALASETEQGAQWDEQIVKQITGGDPVQGCKLYREAFEYNPTYKLLVVGNYEPDLRSVSPAVVRRLHLVPWLYRPELIDKDLGHKLRAEYPAILAWMIEGARKWYAQGLPRPEAMAVETADYLEDQDIMGQWLQECAEPGTWKDFVSTNDLFSSYAAWMHANRYQPGSKARFSQMVRPRLESFGGVKTGGGGKPRGYKRVVVSMPAAFAADNVRQFPVGGRGSTGVNS